ncbi:MAG TPA: RNase adapter RapZ [Nitrospiraceae bacterium]|nr:RNase adapter RapZ [Nitrospiraceae bacterium]
MKPAKKPRLFIVILTGLSGAGKSIALKSFEDIGFFCVDNLPASLIKTFVDLCSHTPTITNIAIGIDIREKEFLSSLPEILSELKRNHTVEIIFLEAKENSLLRRFKETRRPHPLGYKNLTKAIRTEEDMLAPLRKNSDRIIDTSSLNPHQLRKAIEELYSSGGVKKSMAITLISFGYKYGIPEDAELIFDVRFLPNPNFIAELKPFDGTTAKTKQFVLGQKEATTFLKKLYQLLEFLIPLYKAEGRNFMTIGFGCTGGIHRSPAIVEEIQGFFKKKEINTSVVHRELKGAKPL